MTALNRAISPNRRFALVTGELGPVKAMGVRRVCWRIFGPARGRDVLALAAGIQAQQCGAPAGGPGAGPVEGVPAGDIALFRARARSFR